MTVNDAFLRQFEAKLGSDLSPDGPQSEATVLHLHFAESEDPRAEIITLEMREVIRQTLHEVIADTQSSSSEDANFALARAVLAVNSPRPQTSPNMPAIVQVGEHRRGGWVVLTVLGLAALALFTERGREVVDSVRNADTPTATTIPTSYPPVERSIAQQGSSAATDNCSNPTGTAPLLEETEDAYVVPVEDNQVLIAWNVLTATPDGMRYKIELTIPAASGLGLLTDETAMKQINEETISDNEITKTLLYNCAVNSDGGIYIEFVGKNHGELLRTVKMQS